MKLAIRLAALCLLLVTSQGTPASAEEGNHGLKKYEYFPLTDTGRCWNLSCNFGFCCFIYSY